MRDLSHLRSLVISIPPTSAIEDLEMSLQNILFFDYISESTDFFVGDFNITPYFSAKNDRGTQFINKFR